MESGKVAITLDRVEQFAKIFHCAAIDLLRDSSEDFLLQAESIADLIRPLSQKERKLVIRFISEAVQLFSMSKDQYPVPAEPGYLGLVTKLTHAESGQWQSSLAVVPLPKADPQGVGISMTYMRRYALSAMLGIVTEEDTDGEFNSDKLNRPQRQKNAVNAPQRGKTTQDDSGQAKKISPVSNRTSGGLSKLPHLDGISYQIVSAQDGRECVLATGNTAAKKEQLSAAGFHWNPQRKIWWKYAA